MCPCLHRRSIVSRANSILMLRLRGMMLRFAGSSGWTGSGNPMFDLVLLGMGEDGHTASLFPRTDALFELGRIAVANHVPQKDTWRITLTWPVINRAREIAFLIEGAAKAKAVQDVFRGAYDPEAKPAQLIRPVSGRLDLLLDAAAAARLPGTSG